MKKLFAILIAMFIINACGQMDEKQVLLPVESDPTISVRVLFQVGSQNDPEGKEGLAALTASMISSGATENNSYEEILEKLFPIASYYGANASTEMTVYSGRTHKDNMDEYYPLFIDGILKPAFKEEDFNRLKDEMLNYLETTLKYSSDEELGKAVLYNDIFEGTPYGHIVDGTITGIKNITLDDVKEFYKTYYNKNNFVLGVGGGFDDDFVNKLMMDLNTLTEVKSEIPVKPVPKPIEGKVVTIIEKNAPATAISIGYPIDILRGTKEWYALAVANSWLGEHRNSSSHLYQVIREARGLNYGDYSYIEHFPNGGGRSMPPVNVARRQQIFEIWIRPVPNETRHFSLRAALREHQMLIDEGLTQEEFELTKNFLKKYVIHYATTTSMRLGYALDDWFYGIDGSHLQKFREMMDKVTLEDVNNAVKKYLQYDNMKIAVITKDAESFKNDLVNETSSPITYQNPKPASVLEEDKLIQDYPLNINEEDVTVIPVENLFK